MAPRAGWGCWLLTAINASKAQGQGTACRKHWKGGHASALAGKSEHLPDILAGTWCKLGC